MQEQGTSHEKSMPEPDQQIQLLTRTMQEMQRNLERKSVADAQHMTIIKSMHQELETYRVGLRFAILEPLFRRLIELYDDVQRAINALPTPQEDGQVARVNVPDILEMYEAFTEKIKETLEENDVRQVATSSTLFDPNTQCIIDTQETDDPTKDEQIADTLSVGFFFQDRRLQDKDVLIRPEEVITYKYSQPSSPSLHREHSFEEHLSEDSPSTN